MSRARHKAGGGAVKPLPIKPGTPEWLEGRSGGDRGDRTKGLEDLAKRIESGKKNGGKVVGKAPGAESKPRMDKRQRGGRV